MKRSQNLPIGLLVAGICLACICTLAFMTAWYCTWNQPESMRFPSGSTDSAAYLLAAPDLKPDQFDENSDNRAVSLAGYVNPDSRQPLTAVDLLQAARNLSANIDVNGPSGLAETLSTSHEYSIRNAWQSTATKEEIEADRQWLLSIEMNESPEPPVSDPGTTLDPGFQTTAASEINPGMANPNPGMEKTTVPHATVPIGTVDVQSLISARFPRPAEMIPLDQQNDSAGKLPDPACLPDTGAASPCTSDIDRSALAKKPTNIDTQIDSTDPSARVAFATEGHNSLTNGMEVQVDYSQKNTPPAIGSIGDQLSGTEVYTLSDQSESLSRSDALAADSRLAIDQRSQVTRWPLPTSLMQELVEWKSETLTSHWAAAVESTILQLNNSRIDDPESLAHIQYCEQLADQLVQHARTLPRGQELLASRLNRLSMRMKRRFAVWSAVHRLSLTQLNSPVVSHAKTLAQTVNQRRITFDNSAVPAEWTDYLMLDKAAEVFESSKATELHRQTTARKILARVSSPALSEEQLRYARQLIGNELGSLLRDAASGEINPGKFLNDLESFEEDNSAIAEALVNNHFQAFYWSRDSQVQELAAVFDENYRKANFQIEISDRLINNILPRNITVNQPVQDRILGAHVFGNSRVQNKVSVELIPDPDRLSFRLISSGSVLSRTMAHSSGFVFNNLGNALINASKGISIGPEGIYTMPTDVEADAHSKLLNVRSRMDSVPLVGWMARQVAEQKQNEQSQKANLIVEQKLRNEFGSRVDEEIQASVDQGRSWVKQKIVDPFNAMELEPMIANMHTTDSAAIIRYRLAGLDQNASNTVQPRSLPGCLVGVQIHESAINNVINRIGINGETFTAPQFMQHISALLDRPDVELGAGEYEDVKFQFPSRDSVRLDFDEDRIAITLRIKRLQIGRTKLWKNLTVTAWYIPRARGLNIDMALDPEKAVSLSGQDLGVGDQLAVRTVFNALFKPNFGFPLLSPELANRPAAQGIGVSQIVLVDGWAGLSVSEYGPNHQSQVRQQPMLRSARILQNRWR